MKIRESKVSKFQAGGQMPAEGQQAAQDPAAAQGQQDPLMQIAQMAMQALETQDANLAMQVCEAFVSMVQQASGGQQEQGQPVYKKGGKMTKKITAKDIIAMGKKYGGKMKKK